MVQLAMMNAGDCLAQVIGRYDLKNVMTYQLVFEDGVSGVRKVIPCESENEAFQMFAAWIAADETGIEALPGYQLLVEKMGGGRTLFMP